MNRTHFLQTLLAGGMIPGLGSKDWFSDQGPSREELVRIWQISGELTLEFAEAMPAEDYLFRPEGTGDIYTYGGQMQHIAENNVSLFYNYITDTPPPDISVQSVGEKALIKHNIRKSFDYGSEAIWNLSDDGMNETVDFFARPLPRWHVLFVAQDHTTHHCGQAVIYLRALGIEPPSWRKW